MALEEFLAISIFTLLGLMIVCHVGRRTETLAPALVAFSVRWLAAFVVFGFLGLGSPDAVYYDATAVEFASGAPGTSVTAGKEGWPVVLSIVYGSLGHIPQLGLVINSVFAALTVCIIGHASRLLGLQGRLGAWIFALFPSGILWSALLLRESITWFAIALSGVAFLGLAATRRRSFYVAMLIAGLVTLLLFRGTAAITVGFAGLVALAYVNRKLFKTTLLGLLAVPIVFVSPLGQRVQEVLENFSAESINASRESLSSSATTGWPFVDVVDAGSAIQAWAIAAPRVTLGPFPWEWIWSGPVLALDALTWLILAVLSIRGIRQFPKRRVLATLTLPAVALLLALIVTSGNYGTMQRLRMQSAVLLTPVAAIAFSTSRQGADPSPAAELLAASRRATERGLDLT